MTNKFKLLGTLLLALFSPGTLNQQSLEVSITDVRYDVTYNAENARNGRLHVSMSFRTDSERPVRLSLPIWTPGSYEISNFARYVADFEVTSGGRDVQWDMVDFDTWRISPVGPGVVTVSFDFLADTLDNGMTWLEPDFAFFNGTNVFLYPEDSDLQFSAQVTVNTEDDWLVATGMHSTGTPRTFAEENFHDLVDMPVFIGRFDYDSLEFDDKLYRLATYPEGAMVGESRETLWRQIELMVPPQAAVFGEIAWETYTTLIVFRPDLPGGSALEHQNSHVGIYANQFMGSPVLPLITAHEMFHAWNVKRLRPQQMVPYDYGTAQPTELLWISEGITDYYANLVMVRSGIMPRQLFYQITSGKISNVMSTPAVALEDASLSTWIGPTDGTEYIYYDKGSLAGLMLDVAIRNMTDNRKSLDDVMREIYHTTYKQGSGFTNEQWWRAVRNVTGGRRFEDFYERFIDGREEYPYEEVFETIGLSIERTTTLVPRLGISLDEDDEGVLITGITPGSPAAAAGVESGDRLLRIGGIRVEDLGYVRRFQARFNDEAAGTGYEVVVRRGSETLTLQAVLAFSEVSRVEIYEDPTASAEARELRAGILTGRTR